MALEAWGDLTSGSEDNQFASIQASNADEEKEKKKWTGG